MKRALLIAGVLLIAGNASAHELAPGLLELKTRPDGLVDVTWKYGTSDEGAGPVVTPVLPASCETVGPVTRGEVDGGEIAHWQARCGALAGQTISVQGLERSGTDVLVRVALDDGAVVSSVLRKGDTAMVIPVAASAHRVFVDYARLGVEHILLGVDHLVFVLALLMLVAAPRRLVGAVTAFTVGHSVTLVASTLGFAAAPTGAVEAVIALSVLLLIGEVARAEAQPSLTQRFPWIVSGGFGLLHGFGFAGALADVGLPIGEVPVALAAFNVGVEFGQLLFIAAAWPVLAWATSQRRLQTVVRGLVYSVGAVAAFWTIERVVAIVA